MHADDLFMYEPPDMVTSIDIFYSEMRYSKNLKIVTLD